MRNWPQRQESFNIPKFYQPSRSPAGSISPHAHPRPLALFNDHAAGALLAEVGMTFTSLRHGFYAESAFHLISARADLAAADAVVLAEEGRLDGITPPSTAAEAFTMADLAAIASELTGREIRRVIVSDAEWLDAKVAEGVPPKLAETLLGRRKRTMRDALAGILADRRPPCDQGSPNPPAAGR